MILRVGTTGRRGAVRHAMNETVGTALCGVHTAGLASGQWDPDHPRACPRCKRAVQRRQR
jgi:hypothetical protein